MGPLVGGTSANPVVILPAGWPIVRSIALGGQLIGLDVMGARV